jgi:small subunit ribosomal protein S6
VNDYEILLLLDPELPDERQTQIVTRTRETIENGGGKWADHQPWGRRRLAYEIDHKTDGAYHLLTFDAAPETLEEVSRVLRITDGVMRHLAVRRVKGASMRPPEPMHEEPRHDEPRHHEPRHDEPRDDQPRHEEPVAVAAPTSQDLGSQDLGRQDSDSQDSEPEDIAREERE